MSKSTGLSSNSYVWDAGGNLLQEGGSSTSYIYGPGGMLLEQIQVQGQSTTPYYYHADQLGSVRAITNSSGSVVNTYTYDAYGNTSASTGTVANPFKYSGQYTDSETGFLYLRARYYDPATQQFLSVDPLLAQTEQAYAYAGGSPTNFVDPLGLLKRYNKNRAAELVPFLRDQLKDLSNSRLWEGITIVAGFAAAGAVAFPVAGAIEGCSVAEAGAEELSLAIHNFITKQFLNSLGAITTATAPFGTVMDPLEIDPNQALVTWVYGVLGDFSGFNAYKGSAGVNFWFSNDNNGHKFLNAQVDGHKAYDPLPVSNKLYNNWYWLFGSQGGGAD